MTRKLLSLLICFCLLWEQTGFAQALSQPGIPAYLNGLLCPDRFRPVHLRYLSVNPLDDKVKVLLDKGDLKDLKENSLNESARQLLNYFLVGLALPDSSFWVNLRPDSADNMINADLARTDIGRIMLEADLQLKKDIARYTSPQTAEGKQYWDSLYAKAEALFGASAVTIPTMTRPWIVPGEIIMCGSGSDAYIYKATLKVCLESDYLKSQAQYVFQDNRLKILNDYSSELIRSIVLPRLTRDVNTSKRYAPLRQVYYSLILAQWFKSRLRSGSALESATGDLAGRIDSRNLDGLTSAAPWSKSTYFKSYQQSFAKGEYNSEETVWAGVGQSIRRYFSGGIGFQKLPAIAINNASQPSTITVDILPAAIAGLRNTQQLELDLSDPARPRSQPKLDGGDPARLIYAVCELQIQFPKYKDELEEFKAKLEETAPKFLVSDDDSQGQKSSSSVEKNFIAMHPSIATDPIAIFREANRYLLAKGMLSQEQHDRFEEMFSEEYRKLLEDGEEIFKQAPEDDLLRSLRRESGQKGLEWDDILPQRFISFVGRGAHKTVYKLMFRTASGQVLNVAMGVMDEKRQGRSKTQDIIDTGKQRDRTKTQELASLEKVGGKGVPAFDAYFAVRGGRIGFLEEFVNGTKPRNLKRLLPLDIRKNIISLILSFSVMLGGAMVPRDFHLGNFIIRDSGEPTMVDLGEKRLFLAGKFSSFYQRTLFLGLLMGHFGYLDKNPEENHFIFDMVSEFKGTDPTKISVNGAELMEDVLWGLPDLSEFNVQKATEVFWKEKERFYSVLSDGTQNGKDRKQFEKFSRMFLESLHSWASGYSIESATPAKDEGKESSKDGGGIRKDPDELPSYLSVSIERDGARLFMRPRQFNQKMGRIELFLQPSGSALTALQEVIERYPQLQPSLQKLEEAVRQKDVQLYEFQSSVGSMYNYVSLDLGIAALHSRVSHEPVAVALVMAKLMHSQGLLSAEIYRDLVDTLMKPFVELILVSDDISRRFSRAELAHLLSVTTDKEIIAQDITGEFRISYSGDGSHKMCFRLELLSSADRSKTYSLAVKKEKQSGDIKLQEIQGLKKAEGRGVPRFGKVEASSDGRLMLIEEFIEGKEVRKFGQDLPLQARRDIVRELLSLASDLGGGMVPRDFHGGNFILEPDDEVTMVDIGEKRLFLAGKHGDIRHKILFLGLLMAYYGYHGRQAQDNFFIFDVVRNFQGKDKKGFEINGKSMLEEVDVAFKRHCKLNARKVAEIFMGEKERFVGALSKVYNEERPEPLLERFAADFMASLEAYRDSIYPDIGSGPQDLPDQPQPEKRNFDGGEHDLPLLDASQLRTQNYKVSLAVRSLIEKEGDRGYRYLPTDRLSDELLGYTSGFRTPQPINHVPQSLVEIDDVEVNIPGPAIFLVSKWHGGSVAAVRLGFLQDGRPVALKGYISPESSYEDDPYLIGFENEWLWEDFKGAYIVDRLGIGPRFHGKYIDDRGRAYVVMDIVPGDFPGVRKEWINADTFRDMLAIRKLLDSYNAGAKDDFQFHLTPQGRVQVIDACEVYVANGAHVRKLEGYWFKLAVLLDEASAKVQQQALDYFVSQRPQLLLELYQYLQEDTPHYFTSLQWELGRFIRQKNITSRDPFDPAAFQPEKGLPTVDSLSPGAPDQSLNDKSARDGGTLKEKVEDSYPRLNAEITWSESFKTPLGLHKHIQDVVSWERKPHAGGGRSGYILLKKPLNYKMHGQTFRIKMIKIKGLGDFNSDQPVQPSSEVYETTADFHVSTDARGNWYPQKPEPTPKGGISFSRAKNEFRMLEQIWENGGVLVDVPLAYGAYTELGFQADKLGFVIEGVVDAGDVRFEDVIGDASVSVSADTQTLVLGEHIRRRLKEQPGRPVASDALSDYLLGCYREWGRSLRALNDMGILHLRTHSGNWSVTEDGKVVVHDFDSAERKSEMSPEAAFMLQLHSELSGAMRDIHADTTRFVLSQLLVIKGKNPYSAFLEGYFGRDFIDNFPDVRSLCEDLVGLEIPDEKYYPRMRFMVSQICALSLYEPLAAALGFPAIHSPREIMKRLEKLESDVLEFQERELGIKRPQPGILGRGKKLLSGILSPSLPEQPSRENKANKDGGDSEAFSPVPFGASNNIFVEDPLKQHELDRICLRIMSRKRNSKDIKNLGNGSYANVFTLEEYPRLVFKLIRGSGMGTAIKEELVEMQKIASHLESSQKTVDGFPLLVLPQLAPFRYHEIRGNNGFRAVLIVQEKAELLLDGEDNLKEEIRHYKILAEAMIRNKIYSLDMKSENMGFIDGDLVLLDFGGLYSTASKDGGKFSVAAQPILEAFGLDRVPAAKHALWEQDGYSAYRINRDAFPSNEEAFNLLSRELYRQDSADLTGLDLVYNDRGNMIAVFPVLSDAALRFFDSQKTIRYSSLPMYLNLSYFYHQLPAIGDKDALQQWEKIAEQLNKDRSAIQQYKKKTGNFLLTEVNEKQSPYFFVEFYLGHPRMSHYIEPILHIRDGKIVLNTSYLDRSSFSASHRAVLPVFPTVYSPAENYQIDKEYYRSLINDFDLQPGQETLVVGPGAGLEVWIAALRTGKPVHAIGINPLEIANLRWTAQVAGFEVIAQVNDNIISERGIPHFRNNEFDRVIWNMPAYRPVRDIIGREIPIELTNKTRGKEYWDGDLGASTLIRFASGLPVVLARDGEAIVWNQLGKNNDESRQSRRDKVKLILEHAGDMGIVESQRLAGYAEPVFDVKVAVSYDSNTYFVRRHIPGSQVKEQAGKDGGDQETAKLIGLLESGDDWKKVDAAAALAKIGGKDAVNALVRALDSDSWRVRRAAGDALAVIKDPDSYPAMIEKVGREFRTGAVHKPVSIGFIDLIAGLDELPEVIEKALKQVVFLSEADVERIKLSKRGRALVEATAKEEGLDFVYSGDKVACVIMVLRMLESSAGDEQIKQRLINKMQQIRSASKHMPSIGIEVEVHEDFIEEMDYERHQAMIISESLGIPAGQDGIIEYSLPPSSRWQEQMEMVRYLSRTGLIPQTVLLPVHINLKNNIPAGAENDTEQEGLLRYMAYPLMLLFSPDKRIADEDNIKNKDLGYSEINNFETMMNGDKTPKARPLDNAARIKELRAQSFATYNNREFLSGTLGYGANGFDPFRSLGQQLAYAQALGTLMLGYDYFGADQQMRRQLDSVKTVLYGQVDRIYQESGLNSIVGKNDPLMEQRLTLVKIRQSSQLQKKLNDAIAPAVAAVEKILDPEAVVPAAAEKDGGVGGIDFRALPIRSVAFSQSPSWLEQNSRTAADAAQELLKIEEEVAAGTPVPANRLAGYISSCCKDGRICCDSGRVLNCVAELFRLEESFNLPTDPILTDILRLLSS